MVDQVRNKQEREPVERVPNPTQELQNDAAKQAQTGVNAQQQTLSLLANLQPLQQVQVTASQQISKGHLDIKI